MELNIVILGCHIFFQQKHELMVIHHFLIFIFDVALASHTCDINIPGQFFHWDKDRTREIPQHQNFPQCHNSTTHVVGCGAGTYLSHLSDRYAPTLVSYFSSHFVVLLYYVLKSPINIFSEYHTGEQVECWQV